MRQQLFSNTKVNQLEKEIINTLRNYKIPSIEYDDIGDKFGSTVGNDAPGFFVKNMYGKNVLQINSVGSVRIEFKNKDGNYFKEKDLSEFLCDCVSMDQDRIIVIIEKNTIPYRVKKLLKYSASSVMRKDVRIMEVIEFNDWLYEMTH